MATRSRFVVKGNVQGIGFRWFVVETATALKVTGWVRNLPDGSVDGEAQGEPVALESLTKAMKTGHPWASVESVETRPLPAKDSETGFRIER